MTITRDKRNIISRDNQQIQLATITITWHKRLEHGWTFCLWAPTAQIWRAYVRGITMYTYFPLSNLFTSPDNPAPVCTLLCSCSCSHTLMLWETNGPPSEFHRIKRAAFIAAGFALLGNRNNNNNLMDQREVLSHALPLVLMKIRMLMSLSNKWKWLFYICRYSTFLFIIFTYYTCKFLI